MRSRRPIPGQRPQDLQQPNVERLYTGPATPVSYEISWQFYTNLTKDQIGWFKAQPEWQNFLDYVALDPVAAYAGASPATISAALSALASPTKAL